MPAPAELDHVIITVARTAVEREKEFGDLDAVVGDGDFGYSLARGFEIVVAEFDDLDRSDAGTLLKKVALIISRRVGGTSGPIWGTAFLRAGAAASAASPATSATPATPTTAATVGDGLSRTDVVAMLRAAVEGIKARGNSDVGDKTLLDALVPMIDAIETAPEGTSAREVAALAAGAARKAADATSSMQARRGRASYSGERSIGSPDAGAVAVAVMAEAVATGWPQ